MKVKIFKILMHFICWFIGVFLYVNLNDELIKNIISNFAVIVVLVIYMFPFVEKMLENDLKKEVSNKAKNLYLWTDNLDGGDKYLEFLFRAMESNSVPSNLQDIYNKLITETGNSVKKLRILRAYFKAYKDRQAVKLYYKFVGSAIFSFVIFSLQAFLQGRIKSDNFLFFFQPNNSWGFIFSLIIMAIYYLLLPHRKENRINLVVNLLDEIIESEENKLKSEKHN